MGVVKFARWGTASLSRFAAAVLQRSMKKDDHDGWGEFSSAYRTTSGRLPDGFRTLSLRSGSEVVRLAPGE
jgi:hypothetical protein